MRKKILLAASLVFIIDLVSKIIVVNTMLPEKEYYIIPKLFYFCFTKNRGGAWSILNNYTYILAIVAILALIYIIKQIKENMTKLEMLSFILLIGGIIGNLFDRIFHGYVIDFIGVIIFKYHFPIFNVADICIVVGAILLLISAIFGGKNDSRSKWRKR